MNKTVEKSVEVKTENKFESKDYKRSRAAYCLECAFEYFIALLIADAFLATLLKDIGMSDATVGIVSSLVTFAFLFQLAAIFVVQRVSNTKRFVIIFHTASQLLFMSLYFVPFLPFASEYKQILAVICILAAYFGNYFVTSMIYKWGNSYVEPTKRASYSAVKEMISLASGMVMTLVIGYIMDAFIASDNLHGGFIFAAISILVFCICDFVCLILIKNDIRPREEIRERVPMREVLHNTLGNKNFRSVVWLTIIWDIARYTTIGFLGTYRLKELAFSVGAVQVINLVGNTGRFIVSKPFGRYSDKKTFAKGIELALIMSAIAFGINIFTTPESRFLIIVYTLLYSMSAAGTTQNFYNITYSYVDSKYFVQASAIKNSIGGLCGFGASLLASRLLAAVQSNGNTVLGVHVYGQQILSAISFLLLVAAIIYTKVVIEKQKVMLQ